VVASAIFYGVVFWSSSMAVADRKRLNRLMKKASSVLGVLWILWRWWGTGG